MLHEGNSFIHTRKSSKHTKHVVYILIDFNGSIDTRHELPHTIKVKAIFALILTEGYFGD